MLADFGVSSVIADNDLLNSTEGTYYFMARKYFEKNIQFNDFKIKINLFIFNKAEVLDKENKKGFSGKAADIWSLAVTFYCIAYL